MDVLKSTDQNPHRRKTRFSEYNTLKVTMNRVIFHFSDNFYKIIVISIYFCTRSEKRRRINNTVATK